MAEKVEKDWERIEQQFRAGVMSLREIGGEHAVAPATILKRARKGGWERDLGERIRAKAEAAVNRAAVNTAVNGEHSVSERETIEANAQAIATIRLAHRGDIRSGRGLVASLLSEVQGITDRPELIEDLQQALFQAETQDGDEIDATVAKARAQRLRDALDRVVSIGGRVSAVKGLAEAMKNLIALERQAWGLDDSAPNNPLETMSDAELEAEASRLHRARQPA